MAAAIQQIQWLFERRFAARFGTSGSLNTYNCRCSLILSLIRSLSRVEYLLTGIVLVVGVVHKLKYGNNQQLQEEQWSQ